MSKREDELFNEHGIYKDGATSDGGWGRDLATATAILTAFAPAGTRGGVPVGDAPASRRAFPVIGFLLGLVAAAIWALADSLGFYALAASVLALGVVGGLAGLRGEVGCAQFFARLGTGNADAARLRGNGAMILSVLLRVGLLASLTFSGTAAAIVLAAVCGSRIAMALAAGWGGSPKEDPLAGESRRGALWLVALVGFLLLILFLGLWGAIVSALLAALAVWLIAVLAQGAGGLDRPALWAAQQAAEAAILAGAVMTL